MKKITLILLLTFACGAIFAQQEAMYTHYMYNTLGVNPAYAGSRDMLTITALHRSQWVGFKGSPTTQTLTAHSPVVGDAVNLGLSLVNDRVGPVSTTGVFVDYAFRFQLTEYGKLALGLKGGFNNYNFNISDLQTTTPDDPAFTQNDGAFSPNFGVGVYYDQEVFYVGMSVPKILKNDYAYSVSDQISEEERHYYFIAGGLVPLGNAVTLKPTGFLKVVKGAPIEFDVTANFLLFERFLLGAMWRSGDAVGLLAGCYITDQLQVGYAYDFSFVNTTAKYNGGSHEIVISYDFIFKEKRRIRSPRYFTAF